MGHPSSKNDPRMAQTVPIIPLPSTSVLLPGVSLRIPLQRRNDIAAVLANIYSKASTPRPSETAVIVGCIPVVSPFLSHDGKKLIEDGSQSSKPPAPTEPHEARAKDLFKYGTLAKVAGVQGRRRGELSLVVEGVSRFTVQQYERERPYLEASVVTHQDGEVNELDAEVRDSFTQLKQLSRELLALIRLSSLMPAGTTTNLSPLMARRLELYIVRKDLQEAGVLADFMINVVDCTHEEKLRILAALPVKERLQVAIEILQRHITQIQGNSRILTVTSISDNNNNADDDQATRQRSLLRKLGGGSGGLPSGFGGGGASQDEPNEIDELRKRLDEAKLSLEASKVADRELKRLQKMNPAQAEYQVCRTYLENLAEIPWTRVTEDKLDAATLTKARKQLDDDHYGLEKIKKRLLEYLAVLKLKQAVNADLQNQIDQITKESENANKEASSTKAGEEVAPSSTDISIQELKVRNAKRLVDKSPILLLVGPPGTGKTSLAKSVATALGRKFHRISLGGVRDEAEIRGHRRTYVAAMPGLVVTGLKKVGVSNPVILLDEIDKIGTSSFHGDPSAAMLEVLDPEQNHTFMDHYVNIPIDLSKVLFIATANSLDTIPPPLLDRMETIELSGYTTLEKRHIATRHLIPKQITTNGLVGDDVTLAPEVIDKIITSYTREAGVRNLEREIGSVCRYKAVQYSDSRDASSSSSVTDLVKYDPAVHAADLEDILGVERFEEELAASEARPGVVTGLVAYSTGAQGSILFIEVVDVVAGNGGAIKLTGKLGDVLKESVEVALTWVRAHAYDLGLTHDPDTDILQKRSVHVHCPSGAIPKDGPSAGLAHTVALVSLFSGRSVPPTIAMTGEVSLRGKVMPVGGIKEKLIGALRAGVKKVLLPVGNKKDVKDLPIEVKEGLEIVHVSHIWEGLRQVWPDVAWPGERPWSNIDSRL